MNHEHLNRLFEESKAAIISEIEEGVRIFDKNKPICLATDWSKTSVIFLGVGKSRIARKYFMQGWTVLDVISNPANSTTS
jgi:hypothetical protein